MNRALISSLSLFVLIACLSGVQAQTHKPTPRRPTTKKAPPAASKQTSAQADLDEIIKLPPVESIPRLQSLLDTNPPAVLKTRALEHLVSAHAALADEKLQAGDAAGGVDEFKQAVALAPADMSDKLFIGVVSQFPANLFLREQRAAAFEVARLIEAKVKDSAPRLLVLSAFYLNIEQVDEATRLAEAARTLAPDLPAVHQALGAADRLALKLDDAASEYKRALELDPKSALSRRNLADLLRATGKPDDALALYHEQLTNDPTDRAAQTGVVLSLLEAGKGADAEHELTMALSTEPRNLPLLVGAAYWYAAHGDSTRALDLANQAVAIEPRYTWAQVALARALIAQQRTFEAERALRFARQYGRFPTLDYELANALAAAGLYEEAAEELAHTFTLKDGQLETRLAGRIPARAASFTELLAPERRASLFQAAPADTDANARMLKGLLAFYLALHPNDASQAADEAALATAAKDFTAGDDDLRAFRQLYVADRLSRRSLALDTAAEMAEAAKSGVEAAASTPVASVAIAADELRLIRERAINAGGTPDFPVVSPEALTKIMRGRTEELIGWSLFNQGKTSEAVIALRRALSVLPEQSLYWRNAQWRLGAALAASGQQREALNAYVKGYDLEAPDAARRAIIETIYKKVNGSLSGLDALIGPPAPTQISNVSADATASTVTAPVTETGAPAPASEATPTKVSESVAPAVLAPTPTVAEATTNTESKPAETAKPTETAKPVETSPPAEPVKVDAANAAKPDDKPATKAADQPAPKVEPAAPATPASEASVPPPNESKPTEPPAPASSAPTPSPSPTPSTIEQSQPPLPTETAQPAPTAQPPAQAQATPVADKPAEASATEPKATEVKPTETGATETKQAETKPAGSQATQHESTLAPVNEKPASVDESKNESQPSRPRLHAQHKLTTDCALTLSVSSILLTSNGGTSAITASLDGQDGNADINATTADWADIIVLREPQDPAPNVARYTVTSVSKKTGTFLVTFKSPCGTKDVSVTVK
jgi:tetratricopeptide (TPR) repeat protein